MTAVLRESGRTLAVLPLAVHQTNKLRILTWHAGDQSDYGAAIVRNDDIATFATIDAAAVLRNIAKEIGDIDLVYLPKQPLTIGGMGNPLVLPGSINHHAGAHAINFRPGESWTEFLNHRRSASTRHQLRKKMRLLEKAGKVGFKVASDKEEAFQFATHCLAAKTRQLTKLGHYDPFASVEVRTFLQNFFANGVGQSTWAVALTLDDAAIATSIGFVRHNEWLLYQMAMDCDHVANTSPGTQLLMNIMEHCLASGVERLDLALGDENYKFEWCDEHQVLLTSCMPLTFKGRVAETGIRFKASVQNRMAESPRVYDFGKVLKRQLKKLKLPV
ncbi:MAG: GNAT family N-acetyltransferase [Alphaproteobacteria bacterium]|nr:GNAT family N-acetyltransferase [Alphaproteobacteria bacterium]